MDNLEIAQQLTRMAHELERGDQPLYRIRAYRRAAETLLGLDRQVQEIVAEAGAAGLRELPGIGSSLAKKIANLVRAREFTTLNAEQELAAAH